MAILLCYVACLLLASSCNASFISHCQYFGQQCRHRTGDLEGEDAVMFANLTGVSFASNVSCGSTPGDATEYCTLEHPEGEPSLDRFQCFSLYHFDKGTKRRILTVAGCIFNHPLGICTAHTCNFSHGVDLDEGRTNSSLHYCCCHTKDDCNRNGIFGYPSTAPTAMSGTTSTPSIVTGTSITTESTPQSSTPSRLLLILAIVLGTFVFCCVLLCAVCLWVCWKRKKADEFSNGSAGTAVGPRDSDNPAPLEIPQVQGHLSGFQSQATIIGRGRYSRVHKGELDSQEVAIKVFGDGEEAAWRNEWTIYVLLRIQHSNILFFRGARENFSSPMTERYLVTQYHSNGSLSDFLKRNTVDFESMYRMAHSIACGLVFLHTQRVLDGVIPPYTKPTIAHRDLKSKNILVKDNGECCISDFGLATKFGINESIADRQGKVGTMRYMAPEVLEGAITFQMESFLRIDIYAFALVMWELIVRCEFNNEPAEPYREPFVDELGTNVSTSDMLRVVVSNKMRPRFPERCKCHTSIDNITRSVEECWDPDPEARLTAQCFLDNLEDIVRDHGHLPDSGKAGIVAIPEKDPTHPSVLNNAVHHLESNGLSSYGGDGTGANSSGPPEYSSGNYGHPGVAPNVDIRQNGQYLPSHGQSGPEPPNYTTFISNDTGSVSNGSAQVSNGVVQGNNAPFEQSAAGASFGSTAPANFQSHSHSNGHAGRSMHVPMATSRISMEYSATMPSVQESSL